MRAVLTPDDLRRGDMAPTGWHPAEFIEYKEEPASTDGSTNLLLTFKVLDGPAKGVTPRKLFNEKALGFGKSLWAVFFGPPDPVKGYEISTEAIQAKIGSKLKIYIKPGKSNKGNDFNDVVDFQSV